MKWLFVPVLIVLYFYIGSLLADVSIADNGDDVLAMTLFIAWPLSLALALVYICVVFTKRLTEILHNDGGDTDGVV